MGFVESKVKDFYMVMFAPVVNNILVTISQLYNENLIEVRSIEDVLTGREVMLLPLFHKFYRYYNMI